MPQGRVRLEKARLIFSWFSLFASAVGRAFLASDFPRESDKIFC
jgi:hypothetical protein